MTIALHGKSIFSFARNPQTTFQRDCTTVCFHQQQMGVPVAAHSQQIWCCQSSYYYFIHKFKENEIFAQVLTGGKP